MIAVIALLVALVCGCSEGAAARRDWPDDSPAQSVAAPPSIAYTYERNVTITAAGSDYPYAFTAATSAAAADILYYTRYNAGYNSTIRVLNLTSGIESNGIDFHRDAARCHFNETVAPIYLQSLDDTLILFDWANLGLVQLHTSNGSWMRAWQYGHSIYAMRVTSTIDRIGVVAYTGTGAEAHYQFQVVSLASNSVLQTMAIADTVSAIAWDGSTGNWLLSDWLTNSITEYHRQSLSVVRNISLAGKVVDLAGLIMDEKGTIITLSQTGICLYYAGDTVQCLSPVPNVIGSNLLARLLSGDLVTLTAVNNGPTDLMIFAPGLPSPSSSSSSSSSASSTGMSQSSSLSSSSFRSPALVTYEFSRNLSLPTTDRPLFMYSPSYVLTQPNVVFYTTFNFSDRYIHALDLVTGTQLPPIDFGRDVDRFHLSQNMIVTYVLSTRTSLILLDVGRNKIIVQMEPRNATWLQWFVLPPDFQLNGLDLVVDCDRDRVALTFATADRSQTVLQLLAFNGINNNTVLASVTLPLLFFTGSLSYSTVTQSYWLMQSFAVMREYSPADLSQLRTVSMTLTGHGLPGSLWAWQFDVFGHVLLLAEDGLAVYTNTNNASINWIPGPGLSSNGLYLHVALTNAVVVATADGANFAVFEPVTTTSSSSSSSSTGSAPTAASSSSPSSFSSSPSSSSSSSTLSSSLASSTAVSSTGLLLPSSSSSPSENGAVAAFYSANYTVTLPYDIIYMFSDPTRSRVVYFLTGNSSDTNVRAVDLVLGKELSPINFMTGAARWNWTGQVMPLALQAVGSRIVLADFPSKDCITLEARTGKWLNVFPLAGFTAALAVDAANDQIAVIVLVDQSNKWELRLLALADSNGTVLAAVRLPDLPSNELTWSITFDPWTRIYRVNDGHSNNYQSYNVTNLALLSTVSFDSSQVVLPVDFIVDEFATIIALSKSLHTLCAYYSYSISGSWDAQCLTARTLSHIPDTLTRVPTGEVAALQYNTTGTIVVFTPTVRPINASSSSSSTGSSSSSSSTIPVPVLSSSSSSAPNASQSSSISLLSSSSTATNGSQPFMGKGSIESAFALNFVIAATILGALITVITLFRCRERRKDAQLDSDVTKPHMTIEDSDTLDTPMLTDEV